MLDAGQVPFVHSPIAGPSRDSLLRREVNAAAPVVGDPPAECALCGAGKGCQHGLKLCWGAYGPGFTAWSKCVEREVTLTEPAVRYSPTHSLTFNRQRADTGLTMTLNVRTQRDGQYRVVASSHRGWWASELTAPPLGEEEF